jgi:hypothetical protein
MRADAHVAIVRAEVRRGALARHEAAKLDAGRAWVVAGGLGPPRSWWIATATTIRAFETAYDESGQRGADRLAEAMDRAREALAAKCDSLIEHTLPDATVLALALERGELHVVTAGKNRAYLHRKGEPTRLTPRQETHEGLLHATPTRCTVALEPDDVVLAGSSSAFSSRAIEKFASVVTTDPQAPPSVLATILTDPAQQVGVGACAVVLRVK